MIAEQRKSVSNHSLWRVLSLYLLIALTAASTVLGGAPNSANWQILLICATGALLLPVVFAAGAASCFRELPIVLRCAALGVAMVPLVQLIPLPQDIWARLPGRELASNVFAILGTSGAFHELSLVPRDTLFAFAMLLPPAAAFLAAIMLDRLERRLAVWALLAMSILSIMVGVIQFGTGGASLKIYDTAHRGSFLGFFANRNHQGLLMAISGAFAIAAIKERIRDPRLAMSVSALIATVFFIAAIGTLSRAGIGLTILGLLAAFYGSFVHGKIRWQILAGGIVAAMGGLYFVTFSKTVQTALDRFSQIEENERWQIWDKSWPLVEQFSWSGAGIGSYTSVYPAIERLRDVFPFFYNRAHNDYLELVIEAGLPGLLVLALLIWALASKGVALWRGSEEANAFTLAAGTAIILVGLHSIVDYPLRTQAHAVIFALASGIFFAPDRGGHEPNTRKAPALEWSSRSTRFKTLSLAGQAIALTAFVLFASYQQGIGTQFERSDTVLVNSDGVALRPAELAKAKRVLARQPLDQGLLNIVYTSEARAGLDEEGRRKYVATLRKMGWRDTATQQNLLFEAARKNDLEAALDHMDALLRRGRLSDQIMPLLAQLEVDQAGSRLMADRLTQNPEWRKPYFRYSEPLKNPEILDARLRLFDYMIAEGMSVERLEYLTTLNALFQAGRRGEIVEQAQSRLKPDQTDFLLFDPDFDQLKDVPVEERRQQLPYEWRLSNRSGLSAQIFAEEWSSRLVLRWNGRGAPIIARTMTFLTEGQAPELEVSLSAGSQLSGLDSLRFTLICRGVREVLFVRKAAGLAASPGLDQRSAYFEAEDGAPCDYPEFFIGGRPRVGDRGADLSIDSIKLSLP